MRNPRTPGTGIAGARNSLAGDVRSLPDFGPAAQRLHRDLRVQRALTRIGKQRL